MKFTLTINEKARVRFLTKRLHAAAMGFSVAMRHTASAFDELTNAAKEFNCAYNRTVDDGKHNCI